LANSTRSSVALRRAIITVRVQLALLPSHDPRRVRLEHDLRWCYRAAFMLRVRQYAVLRAGRVA